MTYYEFAISEGFGTLVSHSVCEGEPEPVKGDIVMRKITQAQFLEFGPNRVPQYDGVPFQ
jgi:hypothetical protein